MTSKISIGTLVPEERKTLPLTLSISLLDKLLGLSQMQDLYEQNQMQGLSKEAFADKLLQILGISIAEESEFLAKIPKQGPLVIASNHPFGGLEGVILARLIGKVRPDLKVLANFALQIFSELSDYFIFTNPLSEKDPRNGPSLRQSMAHVKNGGALLLFPAGRVSYYRKELARIAEHDWNRIVAKLIRSSNANYLPVFVEGENSRKFYWAGRVHERLRMLFLGRELLNKQNRTICISANSAVEKKAIDKEQDLREMAACARALSYAVSSSWGSPWPVLQSHKMQPLLTPVDKALLTSEINALPNTQKLLSYKKFDVYYGMQQQMPNVVTEIARLRELVFREHDEGSGEPIDTDHFDASYTQLFIFDREKQCIIGAYRMGRSDVLTQNGGIDNMYLSQMFNFTRDFYNQTEPCLEMGRSFIIPEAQRSFHGLYLLWRGIAAFASKYPQYRRLYGTVSLSKLYDKRSIAIIKSALVKPIQTVSAKKDFDLSLHPELADFDVKHSVSKYLSTFVKAIENDSKDIPILLKHYMKIGAEFYALGMDDNFADTPGLLLCVDLLKMPEKQAKLYFGGDWEHFKQYHTD